MTRVKRINTDLILNKSVLFVLFVFYQDKISVNQFNQCHPHSINTIKIKSNDPCSNW